MGKGTRIKQSTNDQLLLLRQEQALVKEGSKQWAKLQEKINQIVAQNYLEYVNR
jgi:hypothetical protein